MNFSKSIPDKFFNIFSSINRDIYLESLFVITNEYKSNTAFITKEECNSLLINHFDKKIYNFSIEEDDDDENTFINRPSSYSSKILNSLIKYGWLEEHDDLQQFSTFILIPQHSDALIDTIKKILYPEEYETDSCVSNIYINLKSIFTEDRYKEMFLENAKISSEKLNRLLQNILHNMKGSFDNLLKQETIPDLFKEHLQNYAENIIDKSYHRLKTEDNLYKFRIEILRMVNELLDNENIQEEIINSLVLKRVCKSKEEAYEKVMSSLDNIKDTFDNIEKKCRVIDDKHNQYVRTSVARLEYLNYREKDIQGNIIKLLEKLSKNCSDRNINIINKHLYLNKIEIYSDKSCFKGSIRRDKFNSSINEVVICDDFLSKEQVIEKSFKANTYTKEDIQNFILSKINDKNSISVKDLDIDNNVDFCKLVMAFSIGLEKRSNFKVNIIDDAIDIGKYIVPNIEFLKNNKNI